MYTHRITNVKYRVAPTIRASQHACKQVYVRTYIRTVRTAAIISKDILLIATALWTRVHYLLLSAPWLTKAPCTNNIAWADLLWAHSDNTLEHVINWTWVWITNTDLGQLTVVAREDIVQFIRFTSWTRMFWLVLIMRLTSYSLSVSL